MNPCFTSWVAYRRTPAVQARLDAQAGLIVQAATKVLSSGGYAALTMAAVAAEAGVATGTVYKNFDGKPTWYARCSGKWSPARSPRWPRRVRAERRSNG